MKITKEILTKIIKEEIRSLRENDPDANLNYMEIMDDFVEIVDKHNISDVPAVLRELIDRWESMQRQDTEAGEDYYE